MVAGRRVDRLGSSVTARLCAEACRRCEQACRALITSLG
jgi:hypothetical protein